MCAAQRQRGDAMKLRLSGDSLRLRLTPDDVAALAKLGSVTTEISFGPKSKLTYCLRASSAAASISARLESATIVVEVPLQTVRDWTDGDAVSLSAMQASALKILIEKDFECLHSSQNPPGIKLYPHPGKSSVTSTPGEGRS
jgi:hypothetical protein